MNRSERTGARWKQTAIRWVGTVVLGATLSWGGLAQASLVEYYVGVDNRATIATGTYAGLTNPNFGRLTLLYAHPDETTPANNHYHGIGAWSYSGPAVSPTVNATNANNRIPETFTNQDPLPLFPQAGKWVSQAVPGLEYRVGSIDQRNANWDTVGLEGDRHGTDGASGLIRGPESGTLAAMEARAITE